MQIILRPATAQDLTAILNIVNYNILNTTALYDYTPKTMEYIQAWLEEKLRGNWPVIVAVNDEEILGYATYGTFRYKDGYKFTIEHSVYVTHAHTGKGVGNMLLTDLIKLAKEEGYHTMIGCIDAENKSSIDFHRKFGFAEAGLIKEAAYKFDKWLDLQFMQLIL